MSQFSHPGSSPNPPKASSAKWIGIGLGLLVLVGVGVTVALMMTGKPPATEPTAASQPSAPKPKPVVLEGPAIETDADDMLNLFKLKRKEATAKYNAKVVDVTGTVFRKIESFEGERGIALNGGGEQFAGVRCFFNTPNHFQISETEEGQTVTIRGRFEESDSNIILRDCAVLKR